MSFQNAHNFSIGTVYAVDGKSGTVDRTDHYIKELRNAACLAASHKSAERGDPPKCHPETRMAVIKDMMSWIDSKDSRERIMWLSGPAGAGKTTIAQTVAERCDKAKKLVSSFFFSRNAGRDDGEKLIPTIASQMVVAVPNIKEVVASQIQQDEALLTYSMEIQMERLIIEPLDYVRTHTNVENTKSHSTSQVGIHHSNVPHLVVIDGLDECKNPTVQSRIIKIIAGALQEKSMYFQFLITSRPELEIRNTFSSMDSSEWTGLVLDDSYNPDKDIKTYLPHEFSTIKRTHTLKKTLSNDVNWPSQKDLKTLVNRPSGQFIYASTVMKYISNNRQDPRHSLLTIIELKHGESRKKSSPYTELDALYTFILFTATDQIQEYELISSVFQALLFLSGSSIKSSQSLSGFLGKEVDTLRLSLVDLHSLMVIPDSNESEI
ncbi:hypothetical protein BDQ17DRAFT_1432527 [Cyathus striatus]|nr:hypothetical protein BDQ17DRAFT_1432527 [Cyathus striatus]